jgi:hypothetical protein
MTFTNVFIEEANLFDDHEGEIEEFGLIEELPRFQGRVYS